MHRKFRHIPKEIQSYMQLKSKQLPCFPCTSQDPLQFPYIIFFDAMFVLVSAYERLTNQGWKMKRLVKSKEGCAITPPLMRLQTTEMTCLQSLNNRCNTIADVLFIHAQKNSSQSQASEIVQYTRRHSKRHPCK